MQYEKIIRFLKLLFKAALKHFLIEANFSNALLKLIFLTKVHEIWMRDY